MRPVDIENPMVLGTPYPEEFDKPVGKCKMCKNEVGYGQGGGVYEDELFCDPICLADYLKKEGYFEEL